MMFDHRFMLVLASVGVLAMCGGKAVLDGESSEGGNATSGGGGDVDTAAGPVTTTGGMAECTDADGQARAMDCISACEIFFCCTERECAGIEPEHELPFIEGCVESCEDQAGIISVINGEACESTINTIRAVSPEFGDTCDNGFGG